MKKESKLHRIDSNKDGELKEIEKKMKKNISFNLLLLNSSAIFENIEDSIESFSKNNIIERGKDYLIYKRNSDLDYPEWLKKFQSYVKGIKIEETFSKRNSEGIILFIKVPTSEKKERIFVASFGSGRFSLKNSFIEKGFGIYTAYHLAKKDENDLKSYQSRLIDTNPINKKMVFGGESDIYNGVPYSVDNELIKELAVSNTKKDDYSRLIGKTKSLEISFSFKKNELPCLTHLKNKLTIILNEYLSISDDEKQELYKGLVLVSSEKAEELNKILIDEINTHPDNFFLFEPDIDFDWTEVDKVVYKRNNNEKEDTNKELSFSQLRELGNITSIDDLKNTNITLISNTSSIIKKWTAFQCLYGEIVFENEVFILSEEEYLKIKKDKYNRICTNVNNANDTSIIIPQHIHDAILNKISPQNRKREYLFNEEYASYLGAELMDEQRKHIVLYEDQIEICDIFDQNTKSFYHSKIKRGPDSISHLFQQGYVSGASFVKFNKEFIQKMNEKITNPSHHISGNAKGKTIHYLILAQSSNPRLSFFQKMSLEEKLTSLTAWGFTVKYSLIGGCSWAK